MKIRMETGGAVPARADFGMLRAGLAAAQAGTPTALASAHVQPRYDSRDALTDLFGLQGGAHAQGLGGRFSTQPPIGEDKDPQR